MRKRGRSYRLSLDDDSRLTRIVSVKLHLWQWLSVMVILLAIAVALGVTLIMATPLKRLMPGYMKADQRYATEESLLRLDSLKRVSDSRSAYLSNMMRVLDTEREAPIPAISDSIYFVDPDIDSLIGSSERERRFVGSMQEQAKYNISVLAPLAASEMTFLSPTRSGSVTVDPNDPNKVIITPLTGVPITAVADGCVVAAYSVGVPDCGTILLQHDRGFLSRYSGVASVTVTPGDRVSGGQAIALGARRSSNGTPEAVLEMWHDSDPVSPFKYIQQL